MMNFKYKFGNTEVIAMIIGTIIVVVFDLAFKNIGFIYGNTIKSLLIVTISVLFGASTGIIVAIATALLQAAILGLDVGLISVVAFLIIAILVGRYAPRYGVRDGQFKGKAILLFAMVKLMAEIFAWMFFQPLLQFLVKRDNLFNMINDNSKTLLMLTIADVILIPVFIIISKIIERRTNS